MSPGGRGGCSLWVLCVSEMHTRRIFVEFDVSSAVGEGLGDKEDE